MAQNEVLWFPKSSQMACSALLELKVQQMFLCKLSCGVYWGKASVEKNCISDHAWMPADPQRSPVLVVANRLWDVGETISVYWNQRSQNWTWSTHNRLLRRSLATKSICQALRRRRQEISPLSITSPQLSPRLLIFHNFNQQRTINLLFTLRGKSSHK